MPPVSWVPDGGVLRRGTPIQNRGGEEEREEEREREAVLSVRERGCLPRNSAEPVDGGRKRGGRVARVRITAWQTKGPPR